MLYIVIQTGLQHFKLSERPVKAGLMLWMIVWNEPYRVFLDNLNKQNSEWNEKGTKYKYTNKTNTFTLLI